MKKIRKESPFFWRFFSIIFVIILFLIIYPVSLRYRQEKIIAQKEVEVLKLAEKQKNILSQRRKIEDFYLPVLLYHYVEIVTDERDTIRKSLSITPATFESQIATLKANGFTPITFNILSSYFEGSTSLPAKPIILSFDDGYRDFYTDVFPILIRNQIPAVLFVTSGFLDYTKNYLTTAQLLEIAKSPLVEIDAHSVTHQDLTFVMMQQARDEIVKSKKQLEALIDRPVEHFAYPFGAYNEILMQEIQDAGYKTASSVDYGILQSYKERFKIRRIKPGGFTGSEFLSRINQIENK